MLLLVCSNKIPLCAAFAEIKKGSYMIKRIDRETCIGCGSCVESCPLDTLRMREEKR